MKRQCPAGVDTSRRPPAPGDRPAAVRWGCLSGRQDLFRQGSTRSGCLLNIGGAAGKPHLDTAGGDGHDGHYKHHGVDQQSQTQRKLCAQGVQKRSTCIRAANTCSSSARTVVHRRDWRGLCSHCHTSADAAGTPPGSHAPGRSVEMLIQRIPSTNRSRSEISVSANASSDADAQPQ